MTRYFLTTQSDGLIVCETQWSDVSDGYNQGPRRHTVRFVTLVAALAHTGGTRYSIDGLVDVYLDGVLIDDQGQPIDTAARAGDSDGWSFGTDSD